MTAIAGRCDSLVPRGKSGPAYFESKHPPPGGPPRLRISERRHAGHHEAELTAAPTAHPAGDTAPIEGPSSSATS